LLFKRALTADELPAATCLENVIFASQVLLGMGLGIVLFDYLPVLTLLAIYAASFIGSLVMLSLAGSALTLRAAGPVKVTTSEPLHWKRLSAQQKPQPPASSGSGSRGGARDGTASRARAANPPDQRSGAGTPFAVCP